jgi:ferredoxin-NADP reductase
MAEMTTGNAAPVAALANTGAPARLGRIVWRWAEVINTLAETPAARSIVLRVPGWPGHLPGQHVDVRLTAEDGYQAQRSYSIASAPPPASATGAAGQEQIVLTVERLAEGEVSPYLTDELRVGDRLEVRGPIGGYFTWTVAEGGPLFLVAGGSGIVPLMSMLRHRRLNGAINGAAGSPAGEAARALPPAVLLYSSRSYEGIIYRTELAQLAGAGDGLQVIHTLTRSAPPDWSGRRGRIDRDLLAAVAPAPAARPLVFVCGPTPLVEAVATSLVALGHDPARIRTERFGPTGG